MARPPRTRRRPRLRRGPVALAVLGLVAATCAGLTPAVGAAAEAPTSVETSGATWRPVLWSVERAPFRLSFLAGTRPLVAQAPEATAGPGGRMAYALADGTTHRLTDLI